VKLCSSSSVEENLFSVFRKIKIIKKRKKRKEEEEKKRNAAKLFLG